MGLDWSDLRALNGSQREGFEEICSQLARLEAPAGAEFFRKGSPDSGVECYCALEDGCELGWQAKFFRGSLGDSQWRQLDRSVKSALEAHPRLVRYFICVPRDLSDSRRAGITTAMQKWEQRVSIWTTWARERDMKVEFVWWGASELTRLLSHDSQVGRLRFWFGTGGQFSKEWINQQLERAIEVAGPRYTPEVHVDVPIVEDFELFGRTEAAAARVRELGKDIRQTSASTLRRLASEETHDAISELAEAVESVDLVVAELYGVQCPAHQKWLLSGIASTIDDAEVQLSACLAPLSARAEALDERDQAEEVERRNRPNPYWDAVREVRALGDALWNASATLERYESVVNSDLLIVKGKAGSGKTHLLCDIATGRLAEGSPTIVLMGQQFTTTELPWLQARAQLDLTDLSAEQFVGAMAAAAQAAGARALFMIDAINEGEGHAIWPPHLADFLSRLRASPWIGVVLSVRSPFIDHIVPDPVRSTAHEVTHHGFADDPYAAVERFCEHYGLDFPATPLLRPEFGNPLFLKTLCEGLRNRGERSIPVGTEGVTTVFGRHLDAIEATITDKLDYDARDRIVARALDAVASELAERAARWLPRRRARELVDPLAPRSGYRLSLYRALVDSGLLLESPGSDRDDDWSVSFGYEWFADHLIAKHLIARCGDAEGLASALTGEQAESSVDGWNLRNAPLEALSILLPELLSVELPSALAGHGTDRGVRRAFLSGLPWRDPARIGSDCRELVVDLLGAAFHPGTGEAFDALMACAVVPHHPLGAALLDEHLRRVGMPDRDAVWSHYLFRAYGRKGPLDRLLDWTEKHPERVTVLDDETAEACAVVLAWCLTASHRFVRDRATKGLVAVLTNKIALTRELVERFEDVDDPYVRERVMAAAYGVAMRSTDARGLAPLAEAVYRLIFAHGKPPAHILLRDYARGVIERAQRLGASIAVDTSLVVPPYRSDWPHIPDDSETERLDPPIRQDQPELTSTQRAQRMIAFSVMHWDFARYVIGTNAASASPHWLSVPITEPPWQSPAERAEAFKRLLDPEPKEMFEALWSPPRTSTSGAFAAALGALLQAESDAAEEPVLPFTVEEPDLDPEPGERFLAALSEEQQTAYQEIKAARDAPEPRLSLEVIQRYVLWRAFDLGWTIERFGDLDWRISNSDRNGRSDTRKPERIGKKYQWIGYHEILAHISDRFQYRARYDDEAPTHEYSGAWQLSVRDIDPSAIVTPATAHGERPGTPTRWWTSQAASIASPDDVDDLQWLRRESDIPDRGQQLRFIDPESGTAWIKLQGMDIWQSAPPTGYDRHEVDQREIWLYACGYLIDAADVEAFIAWSEAVDFSGRWMPEPPRSYELFFGELGWSVASRALLGDHLGVQQPEPRDGPQCPIALQSAAFECSANGGEYDCSLAHSEDFYRPNPGLTEAIGLRWTGYGADFVHEDGTLAAFDPSAHDDGHGALLMREECLERYLNETQSALVWATIGEKQAIKPRHRRDPWAGILRITDAAAYEGGRLWGHRTTRLEIFDRDR
ncbi:AVAST type 2 anti-phage system protein Avs2 [Candidatus Poriferisodalis sp.]|uniref:AVAST type 2 anti-phage system protein Avs2 n=1 Tax=Candidatus Poriferisodalis sp. TaxID=3101277 RepID=UPI003B51727D